MSTRRVNITDAAIKRLAGDRMVDQLHDQTIGSLYFRYHATRQSGSWYLVVKGRAWRKIGRWPEVDAKTIRREAPRVLLAGDRAVSVNTGKTLGDVVTWYRDRTATNMTITLDRRREVVGIINKHLLPRQDLMRWPLEEILRHHIDSSLIQPLLQTHSIATISKIFRVLKASTNRAAALDVIGSDPIGAYRFTDFIQARMPSRAGALRSDDIPAVFDRIRQAAPKAQLLVLMMLMHGTRVGETILTRWKDLDLAGGWWHIPAVHTKTNQACRVPLTPYSIALLQDHHRYKQGRPELFPGYRGRMTRGGAAQLVKGISQGEWASHDLRKVARTIWADLGVDYMVAELLLNHRLNKIDQAYIHTYADDQRRAALLTYHHWLTEHSDGVLEHQDGGLMPESGKNAEAVGYQGVAPRFNTDL